MQTKLVRVQDLKGDEIIYEDIFKFKYKLSGVWVKIKDKKVYVYYDFGWYNIFPFNHKVSVLLKNNHIFRQIKIKK